MNVFIMRSLQARAKNEIAHTFEAAACLRKKLQAVLQEEADILNLLNLAELQVELVEQYKPLVAGRYQCPCCATASSDSAELIEFEAAHGTRRFRCPKCEQDFEIDLQRPKAFTESQSRQ